MAGSFTMLAHSFFDSSIRKETAETRIVFLAILSKCDSRGIVRATDDAIAAHACVSLEATKVALERLSSPDPFSTTPDEGGRRIVALGPNQWRVVNFFRYWNREHQPERRVYKTEKQREYRQRDAAPGPHGPHGPHPDSGPSDEMRGNEKKEPLLSDVSDVSDVSDGRTSKTPRFADDSTEMHLARLLFDLIRRRNPEHREPDLQKWARQVDLMIRVDHRKPEDIRRMIEWCQADEFWQNNILSTRKLRDQFDQLVLKSRQKPPLRVVQDDHQPELIVGRATF